MEREYRFEITPENLEELAKTIAEAVEASRSIEMRITITDEGIFDVDVRLSPNKEMN